MAGTARKTRELVELATDRFKGCESCWSTDALDWVEDLIRPLRLSLQEERRLLGALHSPRCDARITRGTRVVAANQEEVRRSLLSRRFDRRYARQLADFRDHLVRFPMLGCQHAFARTLVHAVMGLDGTTLESRVWYRAGEHKPGKPPKMEARAREQATTAHRFNQMGQVAWYLGMDRGTAAVEVLRAPKPDVCVWIAEVEILEPVEVLDLRTSLSGEDPAGHWILRNVVDRRFISEPVGDDDKSRPQYRVPQFVGDLARKQGFRGLLYDCSRPVALERSNLVLFEPVPAHAVRTPRLYRFEEPTEDFLGWDPLRLVEVDGHDCSSFKGPQ